MCDHPNDYGYCECGCGQKTTVAAKTSRLRGRTLRTAGQPVRFILGHNRRGPNKEVRYIATDCGYKTPCWVWQLRLFPNGYGELKTQGKSYRAHRWYYEQANGPIPSGLQVDHLCFNRACVNPDHLEAVTHSENQRRASAYRKLSK